MRHARSVVIAGLLISTMLAACSDEQPTAAGSGTPSTSGAAGATTASAAVEGPLSVFGYEDAVFDDVLNPFKAKYPDVELSTAVFGSSDEAVAKMQSGFKADVIHVCTNDVERMTSLGLLRSIDTGRITDWDNLIPAFRDLDSIRVDSQVYMIPTSSGFSGIVYNPDEVPQGIDSYRDLFEDPALAGRVTLEDSPLSTFSVVALGLGYEDPFDLSGADLERVKDYVIDHKAAIRTFWSGDSDFLNLYRSGEIVAGFGYHGHPVALRKDGMPVEFVPGEGNIAWICGFGISATTQNLDAAYALVNWYLEPQAQDVWVDTYNFIISNQRTVDALDPQLVETLGLDDPSKLSGLIPLESPENYDDWLKAWREVKSA
jgi:spermidine/putrescine-binding protein